MHSFYLFIDRRTSQVTNTCVEKDRQEFEANTKLTIPKNSKIYAKLDPKDFE